MSRLWQLLSPLALATLAACSTAVELPQSTGTGTAPLSVTVHDGLGRVVLAPTTLSAQRNTALDLGGVPAGGNHLLPSTGVATVRRSSDIGSMRRARPAPTRKVSPTETQIARITRRCFGVMARSFLASPAVEPPIPGSAGVVTAASCAPRDAQNLRRLSSRGARCPGTASARCIPTPPRTHL